MQKLRIGIIGAGGFIGSHLVTNLLSEKWDKVLITGLGKNLCLSPGVMIGDISDYEFLKKNLTGVSKIVHLAGLASVRDSFENPIETLRINTLGTINLLNVCKELNIKDIIIISSAEVYGNPENNPVSENDLSKPLSPYGVSKVAMEQMCFVYHTAYQLNFKILRPFSVYGPGMSSKSIIFEIYQRMLSQQSIELYNTTSIRDYCHIDDLVSAITMAVSSSFEGFEIYNIGSGIGTNSKKLAELIQDILNLSGDISESKMADRPKMADINFLVAEIGKAKLNLNWEPKVTLAEGLKRTINSFIHG